MTWILLLLIGIPTVQSCTKSHDIINNLIRGEVGQDQPVTPHVDALHVDIDLKVQRLSVVPHTNSMRLDGIITKQWTDESLQFFHLNPCHHHVSLSKKKEILWKPELAFMNGDSLVFHKHSASFDLHQNGTVTFSQRFEVNIPCSTDAYDYPWGNTSCALIWRSEDASRDILNFQWDGNVAKQPTITNQLVGDLELSQLGFEVVDHLKGSGVHDELVVTFLFKRTSNKVHLMFFIPSFIFMLASWMSLLLGPMAITRSILVMGSLLLLIVHYYTNMAGLPETTGITSIDIWKIFSLLFVMGTLIELICVTCMASAGRSRRLTACTGKTRRGHYEVEPLYEELNDLRQRKTHTTTRCCKYTALAVDAISLVVFALVFLVFLFFFYAYGHQIVRWFNNVRFEHIQIPVPMFES